MEELETLETLVDKLEKMTEKNKIIDQLQIIGEYILQHCYFQFGEIKIFPLWIEAYYHKEGVFEDPFCHKDKNQYDRFGKPYFHGGIDICLSKGKYCLSYLIKVSKNEQGDIFSQTELEAYFHADKDLLEDEEIIKETQTNEMIVASYYRIGIDCKHNANNCLFANSRLAYYFDRVKNNDDNAASRLLSNKISLQKTEFAKDYVAYYYSGTDIQNMNEQKKASICKALIGYNSTKDSIFENLPKLCCCLTCNK